MNTSPPRRRPTALTCGVWALVGLVVLILATLILGPDFWLALFIPGYGTP